MIEPLIYNPPMGDLKILMEDEVILLVDKPSGLLSVPGKSEDHKDCLEARVKQYASDTLPIHRLDMDTSGVMIFAKDKNAQRNLGLQFERRKVEKTYVARVDGLIEDEEGLVDLPMIVDWPNRPLQKIDHDTGKPAQTFWKVLENETNVTRVELRPFTGRSHQLRVHMKALGHTILGDRFYGNKRIQNLSDRLQLHSETLAFFHPATGERTQVLVNCPF